MSFTHFFYEPFYSLSDLDRLFDEAFSARADNQVQRRGVEGSQNTLTSTAFRPRYVSFLSHDDSVYADHGFSNRVDVHENKEANTITAMFELPGLKKEDVQIDVHNNRLTVAGENKVDSQRNEDGYAIRERRYGKFSRTLPLPQGIKVSSLLDIIRLE